MTTALPDLTLLGMTLHSLRRQPLRTLLTSLGVAVGVVAIVAFGSIARGLWASTNASLKFNQGDLMVFQRGVSADVFSTLDEARIRDALLSDPAVERVVPSLWQVMPIRPAPFCFVMGLQPEDLALHRSKLIEGRMPESGDEAVIGTVAAKMLGIGLNQEIRISSTRVKVVGVFQTDVVFFNSAVILPLRTLQRICLKKGLVTNFQVALKSDADLEAACRRIETNVPEVVAIASADQYKRVDQGLEIANGVVGVIAFLSVVIGGVIVMNTMWMSVHERTREIGVLRALGWPRRRIVRMILIEASGVGLLAWIIGSCMGIGLAEIATRLPFARQFVDPVYDWQPPAMAFAVSVVLSMLGGAAPAWRAARISPVEALRYE